MNKVCRFFLLAAVILLATLACESQEFVSAKMYVQQNNLEKAEEFFLLALELEAERDNAEVPYLLASNVYAKQKRYEEMDSMLNEALRRNPTQRLGEANIEDLVQNLRDLEWVMEYKTGADLFNQVNQELTGEELTEDQRERLLAAREHFLNATIIKPDESSAYSNLVYCYMKLNDREGALAAIERALKEDPENGYVLAIAGDFAMEENDSTAALNYYHEAAQALPDNVPIMQKLTNAYLELGQVDQALATLETIREQAPRDSDVYFNIAALYTNIGNRSLTEGQQMYLAAIEGEEILYDRLEESLEGFHKAKTAFSEAQYNFEYALDLNPADETAARAIGEIQNLQKRLNLLMGSAEKVLEERQ